MAAVLLRHEGGRLLVEVVSGAAPERSPGTLVPTGGTAAGDGARRWRDRRRRRRCSATSGSAALGFTVADGWPELGVARAAAAAAARVRRRASSWSAGRRAPARVPVDTDVALPASFAEQAALALQVAQAQEDRGRLAVFEDRDRIGRDLHDLVIQRLFAVGLTLENVVPARPCARRSRSASPAPSTTSTRRSRTSAAPSSSCRRPPASADLRAELGEAIAVVGASAGLHSAAAAPTGPVDSAVRPELRPHLLAVLREALSNVARHARRRAAEVSPRGRRRGGAHRHRRRRRHHDGGRRSGLRNMAERAEAFGGSFEVRRAGPDGGTIAVWRVPARAAG